MKAGKSREDLGFKGEQVLNYYPCALLSLYRCIIVPLHHCTFAPLYPFYFLASLKNLIPTSGNQRRYSVPATYMF
jgi:hypothetical protein